MIFDTDVQSAFHNFAGVDDVTVVMVTGAAALKSIHLLPTVALNCFVELYDSTTGATGDVVAAFFSGKEAGRVSNGIQIRVPGNGIRFENGIAVKAIEMTSGDETQTVTLIYQGASQ